MGDMVELNEVDPSQLGGITAPRAWDPVSVAVMWQACCDLCGWHTVPASPESAVREWARVHRNTCPMGKQ